MILADIWNRKCLGIIVKRVLHWLKGPCRWINKTAAKWWVEAVWFIASTIVCGAIVSYLLTGLALGADWWDLLTAFGTVGATVFAAVGVHGTRKAEQERKEMQSHLEEVQLQSISSELRQWDSYVQSVLTIIELLLDDLNEVSEPPAKELRNCVDILRYVEDLPDLSDSLSLQANVSKGMAKAIRRFEGGIRSLKLLLPRLNVEVVVGGNSHVNMNHLRVVVQLVDNLQVHLSELLFNQQSSQSSQEIFSDRALTKLRLLS